MDLLSHLSQQTRRFRGSGRNHEGQLFAGFLEVEPLIQGAGVLLRYRAEVEGVGEVHSEATLLAKNAEGKLCLWPVMSELPVVLPHVCVHAALTDAGEVEAIFASGSREDVSNFREEIAIIVRADGRLTYSLAWGMPGDEFAARSRCEMMGDEI